MASIMLYCVRLRGYLDQTPRLPLMMGGSIDGAVQVLKDERSDAASRCSNDRGSCAEVPNPSEEE